MYHQVFTDPYVFTLHLTQKPKKQNRQDKRGLIAVEIQTFHVN